MRTRRRQRHRHDQQKEQREVFRQVPVLPVVVPVAAAIFVTLLGYLHRRDRLSAPRAAVALALCVYAAGVVANTVFPIYVDKPVSNAPWKVYVVPFATYEVGDAVTNIVVFVPLGMLLPLLMARTSWWRVLVVAAASSLTIELAQLVCGHVLHGGHVADVNDLIFNVAGATVGFALSCLLSRVPSVGVLIARSSWR